MRILLDECVNPRVRHAFPSHDVQTVVDMGWGGLKNGKLMVMAQSLFDVFVTVDQNLKYQQNLVKYSLGFVVIAVPDNTSSITGRFFQKYCELPTPLAGAK